MKTIKSFEELDKITSAGKTYIQFSANWCGPCRMITPIVESLESEFPNINFVKIDVDENREIALDYNVRGIPKIVVVENGNILTEAVGAKNKEELRTILNS